MAQPILALDNLNASPQVYRLNFADPTGIGAKIGDPLPLGPPFSGEDINNYHTNFVVRHGTKIYVYHRLRIFVYDELNPSMDWQQLYLFPESFFGGSQLFSGLYVMVLDDDPHLVGIGGGAASNRIQHISWNLRTNTLRAEGVIIGTVSLNNQGFHGVAAWKQFIFWMDSTHSNSRPKKFDFITNAFSESNTSSAVQASYDASTFSPWLGKLYMHHNPNVNNLALWEYDEDLDIFNIVHSIGLQQAQTGLPSVRAAMWQQNGFLYLIHAAHNGSGGQGFKFWRFTQGTTISAVDITTSLPFDLRMLPSTGSEPAAWNDLQRWTAVIDQEVGPGQPQVTIYLAESGDSVQSNLTAYSWADPVLTPVDSGQAGNFSLPQELDGGGNRFYTAADVVPEVTKIQATGTTVRMTFVLHGGGVQTLGIWWEFNQDVPTMRGTLTNPSAGTITGSGNDVLSGITADGVTEYSVEWRAQFDGVSDLDDVNFMIKPD